MRPKGAPTRPAAPLCIGLRWPYMQLLRLRNSVPDPDCGDEQREAHTRLFHEAALRLSKFVFLSSQSFATR